jgi:hypothetical protein
MFMATKNYSSQHSFQASLTMAAKQTLDDMADATRIPKVQLFSQIIEFYAKLPHKLRQEILWPSEGENDRDVAMKVWQYHLQAMASQSASPTASSAPPESRRAITEAIREAADRSMQPQGQPRPNPPHTEDDQKSPPKPHGRKKN